MSRQRCFLFALAVALTAAGLTAVQATADPHALWTIVHDQCVPDQPSSGDPAPSSVARTQEQLHVHIDCIRADVRETLSRRIPDVGQDWAPFPEPLNGHPYLAMAVEGETLGSANPIQLLAERADDMGLETLVVVG